MEKKFIKMNDKKNTQNLKYPIKYEYHFINRKKSQNKLMKSTHFENIGIELMIIFHDL